MRLRWIAPFVGVIAWSLPARADRVAEAEDLFRRGKALMSANKASEACPLFQESQRLDPAPGTLLNLALCHEAIGRIATAWGEFRAVEQQARAAVPPRQDRIDLARAHADKLEPRLSRIKIVAAPEARAPGLVVTIDGDAKSEPLWSGIPVDPGTRIVEARAEGKKPRRQSVKVDDEGVVVTVTVAPLEALPAPVAPRGDLDEAERYASARARRTTGFVVGGIGLATLGAGVVFGVLAIGANEAAKKKCPSPCYRDSAEANDADRATDRALVFANVSNITLPLGLVGAAIGTYLVLTSDPPEKRAARISPALGPRFAGVSGAF